MEKLKISEIARAVGAPVPPTDCEITGICTDSREVGEGFLFVALEGERTDGHKYINSALASGAAFALAEKDGDYPAEKVLRVKSTLKALMDMAGYYRSKYSPLVVGLTGSVGKTTTKEMTAAVLESKYRTIKTIGNRNNEIGGPATIMTIAADTQAAVIEMGMSDFGEIAALCKAAKPDIGIITNIGVSHIQNLGSRENILKAKLELADALADSSPLFICADNDMLAGFSCPRLDVVRYGIDAADCQIRGKIIRETPQGTDFVIEYNGNSIDAFVPGAGRHLVENALAAFGVGVWAGVEPKAAADAIKGYVPSGMRQRVVEHGGVTVVEDCYNASPDSMAAALAALGKMPCKGRKIFVAADMLELGEIALESHLQTGRLAAQYGADVLFCFGELSKNCLKGAQEKGLEAYHFTDKTELAKAITQYADKGDVLWFKGSRGMMLEEAIKYFYEHFPAAENQP